MRSLGRKKAFEIIERASEDFGVELTRKRAAARPINSLGDFAVMKKESFEKSLSKCAQTITVVEDSPKKFSFHVTECLWAKTFRDLNAGDIGYVMECRTDFKRTSPQSPAKAETHKDSDARRPSLRLHILLGRTGPLARALLKFTLSATLLKAFSSKQSSARAKS